MRGRSTARYPADCVDTREKSIERPASGHESAEAIELAQGFARYRNIETRTGMLAVARQRVPGVAAVVRPQGIGVAPLAQQELELVLQAGAKKQSQQGASGSCLTVGP
jgi:hypothetical protein